MRFILVRAVLAVFLISVLVGIIAFARGYRFNLTDGTVVSTGILSVTSTPDAAQIFVNGKFKAATNTNLTFSPGKYNVEIRKDGYTSWQESDIVVKGEVVTQIYALLLPQNASLSPITSLGVVKAINFPIVNKLIILSEGQNEGTVEAALSKAEEVIRDGVHVLDYARRPISIFNPLKPILAKSQLPYQFSFAETEVKMSPDGKQIILTIKNKNKVLANYLLSTEEKNPSPFDVSQSIKTIDDAWKETAKKTNERILQTLKKPFFDVAVRAFDIIAFSPDEYKVFYRAKSTATIPIIIEPRLIGSNQTPEIRTVTSGALYIYDKKDDRNYLIAEAGPTKQANRAKNKLPDPKIDPANYLWYPDSIHLVFKDKNEIAVMDYDGTHQQTVYSGPFEKEFLAVSSDGKLLVLANLNPQSNTLPDVYAVGIR